MRLFRQVEAPWKQSPDAGIRHKSERAPRAGYRASMRDFARRADERRGPPSQVATGRPIRGAAGAGAFLSPSAPDSPSAVSSRADKPRATPQGAASDMNSSAPDRSVRS